MLLCNCKKVLLASGEPIADEAYKQAHDEVFDPDMWGHLAIELDDEGNPLDPDLERDYGMVAWVQ